MTRLDGVDHVFHEAAIPSIPRSVDPPLPSNHANITGTLTLLDGALTILLHVVSHPIEVQRLYPNGPGQRRRRW